MAQRSYYQARPAFTLVEILVVVAIFAILSTIGLVSITNNKNKYYLENSQGKVSSTLSRIQGYTRAGRSVYRTPPGAQEDVPRSYGLSVDKVNNNVGYKWFADFSSNLLGAPDAPAFPHCYSGGVQLGCDPFAAGGFPKQDTIVEDGTFGNNIQVSEIWVDDKNNIDPAFQVDRVDLVFIIPTSETLLYYYDTNTSQMIMLTGNNFAIQIKIINPAVNDAKTIMIVGGAVGGGIKY
jgi:prepilin-type N-terminal cleavage/methylation domain-containing protein